MNDVHMENNNLPDGDPPVGPESASNQTSTPATQTPSEGNTATPTPETPNFVVSLFDEWVHWHRRDESDSPESLTALLQTMAESEAIQGEFKRFFAMVHGQYTAHLAAALATTKAAAESRHQEIVTELRTEANQKGMETETLRTQLRGMQETLNSSALNYSGQLGELRQQVAGQAQEIARLGTRNTQLQTRAESAESLAAARDANGSGALSHRSKTADPDHFDASEVDPSKRQRIYWEWRSKVVLKLGMDHFAYPAAADRIGYIATRLKGEAWESIHERIEHVVANRNDPGTWPEGWTDYLQVLQEMDMTYMVVNAKEEAKLDFNRLRQEGRWSHFSNFITEFIRLATKAAIVPQQQVVALQEKVTTELYNKAQGVDQPADGDVSGWIQRYRAYAALMDQSKWRRAGSTPAPI